MDLDRIVKAYDIRGIYPTELDEEAAHRIGRAFVVYTNARRVAVGRDMRASSEPLSTAFISGAMTQGADVVDLGMTSTDEMYFASGHLNVPGAMFTASHNPPRYNGIKLCREAAAPIGQDTGLPEIKSLASGQLPTPRRTGVVERADVLGAYADHVLGMVDLSDIRPMTVVADAANGMGGLTAPAIFQRIPGLTLIPLYFELDGTFPNHPADPIQPENLKDLRDAVRRHGADLGMAFDGDADRVFLLDENGDVVSGSLGGALVARSILLKHPGETVIHSIICSRVVPETIREYGGTAVRSRVGHSFIKAKMAETNAIYGAEHSGHYYFRENYRADSGLIMAVHVLETLGTGGDALSKVLEPFRRYWNSGEINTEVSDQSGAMERIGAAFPDGASDRTDGLTVEWDDRWFNVRPSNTEPLLRLNVEARTAADGEALRDRVLQIIRE